MRAPVAARELALMALSKLAQADADQLHLTHRITASGNLNPAELYHIEQILETPADTTEMRLAHALLGGQPMLRAIKTAAPEFSDGIMVALVPTDPDTWTVEGGLPADDIHVTLAYLGKTSEVDAVAGQVLTQAVEFWAASERAFHAVASHRAHLGKDPEEVAIALEIDSDEIRHARRRLTDRLDMHGLPWSNRYLFRPHMTETYLPLDDAPDQGPLDPPLPISFQEVIVRYGTEESRFPLSDAPEPQPNVTANAQATDWPALNAEMADVLEVWEQLDVTLTAQVATAIDMGWRAALERVGRSITKATNGDRNRSGVLVAAAGESAAGVNAQQLIAGPVSDTVEQVGRILRNAWDQALEEIFSRFAVLLDPEELVLLTDAADQATAFLEAEMTRLLLDRLEGPAAVLLAEEPIPVDDPGAVPGQLVADVLSVASLTATNLDGGPIHDNAGRPVGKYVATGGDGLFQGPAGMWVLELTIDAWAEGEDATPAILAAGRRGGALISDRLREELADAAHGVELGERRIDYRTNVSPRRVQVVENTWTLEMNGTVTTQHEPVHEALAGVVIVTESELDEVPAAAADAESWPYVGSRRPGDHRYCKCGWRTRVRWVEA